MRIVDLSFVPVVEPRAGVLVRLTDSDGRIGWGEATPVAGYGSPPVVGNFAIETALLDLEAQRAQCSVAELLAGGPVPAEVPVNVLITGTEDPPPGAATVKMKVGRVDDPERDVERVAAIRARVGPGVALRLDANGAWTPEVARRVLDQLAAFDVEYVEEPVAGMDELVALAATSPVTVAADESLRTPADVERVPWVVLKPAMLGGPRRTLRLAERARAAGVGVTVTSLLEGPVGEAAATHTAAAVPGIGACGLRSGVVPAGPGLGVDPVVEVRGPHRAGR